MTPDGPDVAELERVFAEHRPRLYLTGGGLQNPTGVTPSAATVHRVLRLAEEHDVLILEDDTFADFEAEPSTRLAALDGLRRVVQVGSATKAVGAAMRCGYIAAREDWIAQLVDLKLATTMGNSATGAHILHRVLTESGYRRHLDGLRRKLADSMGRTLQNLRAHGLVPWIEPRAGIYVWARLPDGVSAADVARHALTRKVMFAPGPAFSASDEARGCLRFNVARCGEPARLRGPRRSHRRRSPPRVRPGFECRALSLSSNMTGRRSSAGNGRRTAFRFRKFWKSALFAMTGARVTAHGAGRTDAGVHARGQVAHVDLERDWSPFRLSEGLNALAQPHPVAVLGAERVSPDFDARHSATARHYLYRVVNRRAPLTFERGSAWRLKPRLDAEAMHAAARVLIGRHDFSTFRDSQCQANSPIRTLDRLDVRREGDDILFEASARSFLHRQVRSMVGTLVEVGAGRWSAGEFKAAFEAADRSRCGPVAPPHGLYLVRVDYSEPLAK